jgi:GDPmannose 4,6-dehydratase
MRENKGFMHKALITGVTGMDGSTLAEFLITKGYQVYGLVRRTATPNTTNIKYLLTNPKFTMVSGDILDAGSVRAAIDNVKPDEVYNLACQSHVHESFKIPAYTFQSVACGTLNVLEAIRQTDVGIRMYQASSSEMFGSNVDSDGAQRETTPLSGNSPYAVGKIAAHNLCGLYRKAYNMHVSCGILFNHEGRRRGHEFVTRKVTRYVAQLHCSKVFGYDIPKLELGNLDARRDWGWADDYVRAMWLMLQQYKPDDYVIATGETHTITELLEVAFNAVSEDWRAHVVSDPKYVRPAEVPHLLGDASKAEEVLKWQPSITFKELIEHMVTHDIQEAVGLEKTKTPIYS